MHMIRDIGIDILENDMMMMMISDNCIVLVKLSRTESLSFLLSTDVTY